MQNTTSAPPSAVDFVKRALGQQRQRAIVAAYGDTFDVEAYRSAVQTYCQEQENTLYLPVNIQQGMYAMPEDALFTIIQQLINALIDVMPADAQPPLLGLFRSLWNVQNKVKEYTPEEQRAEFMQFSELSCFPVLRDLLAAQSSSVALVFYHFERVTQWSGFLYNFLLAPLKYGLDNIPLRIVALINADEKPGLFYGSAEESAREHVFFYKLP